MRGRLGLVLLILFLAAPGFADDPPEAPGSPAPSEDEGSFADRVNAALDHGIRWLLARPMLATIEGTDIAHWGLIKAPVNYLGGSGTYPYPIGMTSLALYTLLKCGVEPDHPVIERGFAWLEVDHRLQTKYDDVDGKGYRADYRIGWTSYEIAAQILALTAKYDQRKRSGTAQARRRRSRAKIGNKDHRKWLSELVKTLVNRRGLCGEDDRPAHRRGWRYNTLSRFYWPEGGPEKVTEGPFIPPANQDLSSTQLAALALYSAHQLSVDVRSDVWVDIATFTLDCQEESGPEHARHAPGPHGPDFEPQADHARGFCYIKGSPTRNEGRATGAMTACGIANLLMARDVLGESSRGKRALKKDGLGARMDAAVWDGLAWLDLHWSPFENPPIGEAQFHVYYLYALERAMDLMGKELVGKHLWYGEGAKELLDRTSHGTVRAGVQGAGGPGAWWNTGSTNEPCDVQDTCFALLFLRRATKDVAPPVTAR